MDTRPRKRQKRLILTSSEDEEDAKVVPRLRTGRDNSSYQDSDEPSNLIDVSERSQRILPTRTRVKASKAATTRPPATTAFASRSPSSSHSTNGRKDGRQSKNIKSRSISTYFDTGTASHERDGCTQRSTTKVENSSSVQVEQEREDIIEDDFPVEQTTIQPRTNHGSYRGNRQGSTTRAKQNLVNSSQRFKTSQSIKDQDISAKGSRVKGSDSRPWAERYGPSTLEELAVNKRKVTEVKTWLERVWSSNDTKRLLVLKGPSGAGKSAIIAALAKNMGFDIVEWRNPIGSEFASEGYSSMSAQFGDFLGCGGRFAKLDLSGKDSTDPPVDIRSPDLHPHSGARRIILVEEFPTVSLQDSNILQSFRKSIVEYLTNYTPSLKSHNFDSLENRSPVAPLVMIITETRQSLSIVANESFTAHRLLGSEILNHIGVGVIEFGPIAPTFLNKALELVLQKEARHSGRRRIPGSSVLKKLGEVGDIRSAIGSLEFLCVRGDDRDDWGGRVAAKGKKGASASFTRMEQESLRTITQREASLGIFHAVGKVVYNKRLDNISVSGAEPHTSDPPQHLLEHARPRATQVNVNQLIDETGCDTGTFVAALHENYLMSCEGPTFIGSLNGSLNALSDTDLLTSSHRRKVGIDGGPGGRTFEGNTVDSLRAEEISFQLAVRGILFSLPDPVKRSSHPVGVPGRNGGKVDAYKMYYPTSIRLFKQIEEIGIMVDQWVTHLQSASLAGNTAHGITRNSSKIEELTARKAIGKKSPAVGEVQDEHHRIGLNINRSELVIETLPYLSRIKLQRPQASQFPEIEKITLFHGILLPSHDPIQDGLDGDDILSLAEVGSGQSGMKALQADASSFAFQEHGEEGVKGGLNSAMPPEENLEKLYLTDDDIEDD